MKPYLKLIILPSLLLSSLFSSSPEELYAEVEKEIRKSIEGEIGSLPNPFILSKEVESKEPKEPTENPVDGIEVVSEKVEKKEPKILEAILNDSARIDGLWYKVGDSIYGLKITSIGEEEVKLSKGGLMEILKIESEYKIEVLRYD